MKVKEKPCKSMGKAKGFEGCGKSVFKRTHGLCMTCYPKWLLHTPEGKEKLSKSVLYAKNKNEKDADKKRKSEKRNKISLYPEIYHSELKSELQKSINMIARLIDEGDRCIDCERTKANPCWDGGHFRSRKDEPKLRWHLDNIFKQTRYCNHKSEGNKIAYLNGIKKMYGKKYADRVENLRLEIDVLKMPHAELPEKLKIARAIVRELKKADLMYPAKTRIKMRERLNERLGIYPKVEKKEEETGQQQLFK